MTHPIGPRIREALEVVERLESATTPQIRAAMPGPHLGASTVCELCHRAVGFGWMTVKKAPRASTYSVVEGWREALEAMGSQTKRAAEPSPRIKAKASEHAKALVAAAMAVRPEVRTRWVGGFAQTN